MASGWHPTLGSLLAGVLDRVVSSCAHEGTFELVQARSAPGGADVTGASLETVRARCAVDAYPNASAFRRDFELMLADVLAYHTRGTSAHARPEIVGWVQELQEACCAELHAIGEETASTTALREVSQQPEQVERAKLKAASPKQPHDCLKALVEACAQAEERKDDERAHSQPMSGDMSAGTVDAAPPSSGTEAAEAAGKALRAADEATADHAAPPQAGCGRLDARTLQLYASPLQHWLKHPVSLPPKKVMYLPTAFVEGCLQIQEPLMNCWLAVDLNGEQMPMLHAVTVKTVPRRGQSTMYCMTRVLDFQPELANWRVTMWSKLGDGLIMVRLHKPIVPAGVRVPQALQTKRAHQLPVAGGSPSKRARTAGASCDSPASTTEHLGSRGSDTTDGPGAMQATLAHAQYVARAGTQQQLCGLPQQRQLLQQQQLQQQAHMQYVYEQAGLVRYRMPQQPMVVQSIPSASMLCAPGVAHAVGHVPRVRMQQMPQSQLQQQQLQQQLPQQQPKLQQQLQLQYVQLVQHPGPMTMQAQTHMQQYAAAPQQTAVSLRQPSYGFTFRYMPQVMPQVMHGAQSSTLAPGQAWAHECFHVAHPPQPTYNVVGGLRMP